MQREGRERERVQGWKLWSGGAGRRPAAAAEWSVNERDRNYKHLPAVWSRQICLFVQRRGNPAFHCPFLLNDIKILKEIYLLNFINSQLLLYECFQHIFDKTTIIRDENNI